MGDLRIMLSETIVHFQVIMWECMCRSVVSESIFRTFLSLAVSGMFKTSKSENTACQREFKTGNHSDEENNDQH